jgi:tRNA(Ile)-lysidine synthase
MAPSFDQAMRAFEPALPLALAYSGGADSTALLLACVRKWPGQVLALHVNHGLQAAAAEFESHCQAACRRLGVPLQVAHVVAHGVPGQSPEDAARAARYQAFDALAHAEYAGHAIESVALAQHADDQAETVLLALSRGAGVAGLSGMPAQWQRAGMQFHRPLLQVSGHEVRRWLHAQAEPFIDDPSNTDTRYTRNHMRAVLLPALQQVFPHFRDTLARSAGHAAQAHALLEELAIEDRRTVVQSDSGLPRIRSLQALSPARQSNLLRHWLKASYRVVPSAAQLQELRKQVQACTTRGHQIHLKVGAGFVQRRGAVLVWADAPLNR